MATIRTLPNGKFRVEITKNYTFIQSKTFLSKQVAQDYADDMDLQIENILNLKPKKEKKLTPKKVETLGGMALFKKLGVHIEFVLFNELHNEYLRQWKGKDQINQTQRAGHWLKVFNNTPIKAISPKVLMAS